MDAAAPSSPLMFSGLPLLAWIPLLPLLGALWNLVLGTKYSLRYLSVGQNIPGDLTPGTPQKLLQRQFSHK